MVRTLQRLERGLDERIEDIEEPELLAGIKLGGADKDEENEEVFQKNKPYPKS